MKDRASGSIGRRLIWSGRVVFIGRDAAFEGVIANAVTAGSTVSPIVPHVPLGSRDREVRYRLHSRTSRLGWRSALAALSLAGSLRRWTRA